MSPAVASVHNGAKPVFGFGFAQLSVWGTLTWSKWVWKLGFGPLCRGSRSRRRNSNAGIGEGPFRLRVAVDDLEAVVDELTVAGVAFERYEAPPITTDEKGIAVLGASKAAWFKDPDGNMLGLLQE